MFGIRMETILDDSATLYTNLESFEFRILNLINFGSRTFSSDKKKLKKKCLKPSNLYIFLDRNFRL